jgi:hypothetical protein
MSIGSPVVLDATTGSTLFTPLTAISTKRDDPEFFSEKLLQNLIADAPSVLPVREFFPATTALFSLAREVPVDIGGSDGRIDNLLVTNNGHLVIVETKLYRNPDATRSVVTQTLQYGMAVSEMSVLELEAKIRLGQNPALRPDESIRDCVSRLAANMDVPSDGLSDDFDASLEQYLRQGDVLLLVATDAIRVGVSRISHWLNEQSSSAPFKFGLVELKFYKFGDQRIVIPRTTLRTREVSRHVVVVDIKPQAGTEASAVVQSDFRSTPGGGILQESRSIKSAKQPLTKAQLFQMVSPDDLPTVEQLLEQMEKIGLDQNSSSSWLRVGITHPEDGDFFPLVYFGYKDVFIFIPKRILNAVDGNNGAIPIAFRKKGGEFGFYRPTQIENPNGLSVKYPALKSRVPEFASYIGEFSIQFLDALQANEPG